MDSQTSPRDWQDRYRQETMQHLVRQVETAKLITTVVVAVCATLLAIVLTQGNTHPNRLDAAATLLFIASAIVGYQVFRTDDADVLDVTSVLSEAGVRHWSDEQIVSELQDEAIRVHELNVNRLDRPPRWCRMTLVLAAACALVTLVSALLPIIPAGVG